MAGGKNPTEAVGFCDDQVELPLTAISS